MHDCINGTIDWFDVIDKMFWRILIVGLIIRVLWVQRQK